MTTHACASLKPTTIPSDSKTKTQVLLRAILEMNHKTQYPETVFNYTRGIGNISGLVSLTPSRAFTRLPSFRDILNPVIDFNHDGLPDMMKISADTFQVQVNNGDMNEGSTEVETIFGVTFDNYSYKDKLADFTGDGLVDIVRIFPNRIDLFVGLEGKGLERNSRSIALNDTWIYLAKKSLLNIADLNGDGKSDLIGFHDVKNRFTVGFTEETSIIKFMAKKPYPQFKTELRNGYIKSLFQDVNGDRLADHIIFDLRSRKVFIRYNLGHNDTEIMFGVPTGFPSDKISNNAYKINLPLARRNGRGIWFKDINIDGHMDIIYVPDGMANQFHIYLNQGLLFASEPIIIEADRSLTPYLDRLQFHDFDGDGFLEGVFRKNHETYYLDFNLKNQEQIAKGGLLSSIQKGLFTSTKVTYTTTSQERQQSSMDVLGGRKPFNIPFSKYVVKRVSHQKRSQASIKNCSLDYPANGATTITYYYQGGRYDFSDRKFLGFQDIAKTVTGGEQVAPRLMFSRFMTDEFDGKLMNQPIYTSRFIIANPLAISHIKTDKSEYIDVHNGVRPKFGRNISSTTHGYRPFKDGERLAVCSQLIQKNIYDLNLNKIASSKTDIECDKYGNILNTTYKEEHGNDTIYHRKEVVVMYDDLFAAGIYDQPYTVKTYDLKHNKMLNDLSRDYYESGLLKEIKHHITPSKSVSEKISKYDEFGNILNYTDRAGKVWSITFDDYGIHTKTITNPLGHSETYYTTCDDIAFPGDLSCLDLGEIVARTGADGVTEYIKYDDLSRPKTIISRGMQKDFKYHMSADSGLHMTLVTLSGQNVSAESALIMSDDTGDSLIEIKSSRSTLEPDIRSHLTKYHIKDQGYLVKSVDSIYLTTSPDDTFSFVSRVC